MIQHHIFKTKQAWRSSWSTPWKSERLPLAVRRQYQPPTLHPLAARKSFWPAANRYDFPGVNHEGRQAFSVLIFVVTQTGSPYIKDSLWLSLLTVITFYSPSCLGQETRLKLPPATCLPHTMETSHRFFNCWTTSREVVNTKFYSLWFDPIGNWTRVHRFSSRRSIHSTTDRFKYKSPSVFHLFFREVPQVKNRLLPITPPLRARQ